MTETKEEFRPVRERLHWLPLFLRFTFASPNSRMFGKRVAMALDGVGFIYQYTKDWELEPDFIRRHMFCRDGTHTTIEAPDSGAAIRTFYNEWEGAQVGGRREESKALWIDRKRPVLVLPKCKRYAWRSLDGQDIEIVCGMPTEEDNRHGGILGCVLAGFDFTPSGCPLCRGINGDPNNTWKIVENGYTFMISECKRAKNCPEE